MADQPGAAQASAGAKSATLLRPTKSNLAKVIPTDRVAFEKQAAVLRAYAAASGSDKKAVTNEDVAAVMSELVASSISLCNPFFSDAGLLIQEGRKLRPVEAIFDYHHAYEWNPETAGLKLGAVLAQHWAAKTLVPKLGFRQLSKDEAIAFLAEESRATTAHRKNLDTLLEFLGFAGVIRLDGNTVYKAVVVAERNSGGSLDVVAPAAPLLPSNAAVDDAVVGLDPMIQGLFKKLPKSGSWPIGDRMKWLRTAANIFDLVYDSESSEGGIQVTILSAGVQPASKKEPEP